MSAVCNPPKNHFLIYYEKIFSRLLRIKHHQDKFVMGSMQEFL